MEPKKPARELPGPIERQRPQSSWDRQWQHARVANRNKRSSAVGGGSESLESTHRSDAARWEADSGTLCNRRKSESPAPERSDPRIGTSPIPWGRT
jgi:hypothetical protein